MEVISLLAQAYTKVLSCVFHPGKDSVLTWERRVKILRDCALALRYLHYYIDGCIVHRDIKVTEIFGVLR